MRDSIESVSFLQKQINSLQLENQILKNILDRSGISYVQELKRISSPEEYEDYDPDQGGRIKHPNILTTDMLKEFKDLFSGRNDVYAKRSENKKGEVGYYPQCENFWTDVCPRKRREKTPCSECDNRKYRSLSWQVLIDHLQGKSYNASDVIGVYPLLPDGTCRFLVFDFDNHEGDAEKEDYANKDQLWIEEVEAMREICILNGIDPLVERSRSGKGAHIWIFFDTSIPASLARRFGFALLDKGADQINLRSFKYYDRMLPAQDSLPEGSIGNLIALPLQGKALRDGNSAFVDINWNAYPDQWEILHSKPRLSKEFLELKIREWDSSIIESEDSKEIGREKPWKKEQGLFSSDVDGKISITLSNSIYIDSLNLKPRIQNRFRHMAAYTNPNYYKNPNIGKSNRGVPRWIYLGRDHLNGYIEIPRGLYEKLISDISEDGIPYEVSDERECGNKINVSFKGTLREEQKPALDELMKYENGILHAATAFGKTVVCAAIIAERKVNTLIILQSSALVEQWTESLREFLDIDEEFPTYKTKTGRIRTRKSLIGRLQGAHDSTTGIIDIAMAGSICKKGEFHPRLNQYGRHMKADASTPSYRRVRCP